jgi:hypothetical protein
MRLETLAGPPPHRSIARTNNAVIFVRASIAKIKLLDWPAKDGTATHFSAPPMIG